MNLLKLPFAGFADLSTNRNFGFEMIVSISRMFLILFCFVVAFRWFVSVGLFLFLLLLFCFGKMAKIFKDNRKQIRSFDIRQRCSFKVKLIIISFNRKTKRNERLKTEINVAKAKKKKCLDNENLQGLPSRQDFKMQKEKELCLTNSEKNLRITKRFFEQ